MSSNFIKNFLLTGASTAVIILLSIANNIIVTRWIGVEGRGVYGVVLSVTMFLNLLFGEGARRSNTVVISESSGNLATVIIFNLLLLFALLLLAIISIPFYDFFLFLFPNIPFQVYILMIFISVFFIMWNSSQGIFLGLNDLIMYNLIPVSAVALILIFNVVGILVFKIGLQGIFINILVAYGLVFLIPFLMIFLKTPIKNVSFKGKKLNLLMMSKATLSSLGVFTFRRSNIFFVNNLLGVYDAGLYSVANIFSDLIQKLPNVAGILVFSDSAKKNSNEFNNKVASLVRTTFFFNLFIVLSLILWGDDIISFVFGNKFVGAFIPLKLMFIGFIVSAPTTIIHAFFMGKGFPKKMIFFNWLTAFVAIVLNYLLVEYFNLLGAGLSSSISFLIWSVLFYYYFTNFTKIKLLDLLVIKKQDFYFIREILGKRFGKKEI